MTSNVRECGAIGDGQVRHDLHTMSLVARPHRMAAFVKAAYNWNDAENVLQSHTIS